jgi:hypothetical protein
MLFALVIFMVFIAASPAHSQPIPAPPATSEKDEDLVYHWDDPKYSAEERLQLGGCVLILGAFAASFVLAKRREKPQCRK